MALMTQVGLEFIARDRSGAVMNQFNRGLTTMTRSILQLAGIGGGMYVFANVMRSGIRESAAFERQMSNVSTMLNDQSMSLMPRYAQRIREMSRQFGEGTETLSKGLYDILSASVAPARALDVLAASTKAAKAGITDTGIAADAITTILNSYSLEADMAGSISDKLFAIVTRGKTTFAELAPNIGKVTALAATAGESFDDLGASIATMTRAGVQTEIAITSLRAIILSFLKPQSDSIEMARKYGVELNSNTLRTIGLTGVMQKLKKATAEELAVIVPTSRAITGFAAAIQKADALAEDYGFVLNSLGATEKAYQKIADTSAFKIDQLNQEWIDMKRAVGDLATGPLIDFLRGVTRIVDELTEAIKNSKKAAQDFNNFVEKHKLAPAGGQNYGSWAPMPQIEAARSAKGELGPSAEGRELKLQLQREQTLAMMAAIQLKGLSAIKGHEIKAPLSKAAVDQAAIAERTNEQILADTREHLASVRSMHDRTRMEKIAIYRQYVAEHKTELEKVKDAEKLINDEILALERARIGGMEIYYAELRDDMENIGLYISDKFGETARSIEGSMSNAFYSMRQKGQKWHDAMDNFIIDVGDSFARMTSDMAARALMGNIVMPVAGGIGDVLASFFHRGGIVGTDGMREPISALAFAGAPRMHSGGLAGDEVPIIAKRGETILPAGMKMSAPNIIIYNESGQPIQQKGQPEFDGESWVVSLIAKNYMQGGSLTRLIR